MTRSSQIKRCHDCRDSWEQLLSARAQRHLGNASTASGDARAAMSGLDSILVDSLSDLDSGLDSDASSSRGGGQGHTEGHSESHSPSSVTSSVRSTPERSDTQGFVFDCIVDSLHWISQGYELDLPSKCNSAEFQSRPMALKNADHVQVLCTGSLHLIGGVLGVLDPDLNTHCS